MTGVSSLSLNILVPAIPGLVTKFAADPAHVQLTVSLYLLGLAVAQLVFGPLSDRFGRRPVVLAGLALATRGEHRRDLRRQHRQPHRRARGAVARRLDRPDHRPRHHPRPLRPRARGLHDRPGHLGRGAHADDGAAHRRHPRHAVRLGVDLHLRRRAQLRGVCSGPCWPCRRRAQFSAVPGEQRPFSRRPRRRWRRARASSATRCAPGSARRRSSAFSAARRTWS